MTSKLKFIFIFIAVLFISKITYAGELNGVIIKDDGNPLSDTEISVVDKDITIKSKTNVFGGYKIKLTDGEKELKFTISGAVYITEKVNIYSPSVKQNWKIDSKNKRLVKTR